MPRRVAVTGVGPVTPIGTGKQAFWEGLCAGQSGVRRVDDQIDLSGIDVLIGAPVVHFDPLVYVDKRRARRIDRATQFALGATHLALVDAGLSSGELAPDRTGVVAGIRLLELLPRR